LSSCLFLCLLAPRAPAQSNSPFMQEFRKLMPLKDEDQLVALMRKHEQEAVLAVIEICDAISQGSNELLETEIDQLNRTWKKAFNSKFVDYQYGYFSV